MKYIIIIIALQISFAAGVYARPGIAAQFAEENNSRPIKQAIFIDEGYNGN